MSFVLQPWQLLFAILAGCTPHPHAASMQQIVRNLTDDCDGFLPGIRYLIMDRDGSFCAAFRDILKSGGVDAVRLPPQSPNRNACVEWFHGSLKSECLERLILFGETMLRNAVREFLRRYHSGRNHQGLCRPPFQHSAACPADRCTVPKRPTDRESSDATPAFV